ncbi:MAG TPA: LiaF domain-containing protein [Gemmatimonadaceae bacterium]|nr:LiaF domain-containing protein [Gemmatimonadaceae bacterium]
MTRVFVLGGALLVASLPLSAQSWQTLSVERATLPKAELSVVVRQHAGKFSIKPSRDSVRYRATLRFDAQALEPIYRYDADSGALRLGTRERQGASGGRRSGNLDITLGAIGTLAIDVQASAAETQLDLTGLPITSLAVSSGASDTRVRFDRPNPVRMKSLTLSTGAASILVDRLGNANAEEIIVRAGVGEIELDMAGTWLHDTELRAEVSLGVLTIRVPTDVGVRVETSRVLASFSHEGLSEQGAAYVSDNWENATHKLRIYAQTVVGFLSVERR